jgi:asparagine synthase (glutamine-hydrolysing)
MCGLQGIFSRTGNITTPREWRSPDVLSHRGPDHADSYASDRIFIAHNKLSILDDTSRSHQPIKYEKLVIAFNGEIYNYRDLADDLTLSNVVFDGDVLGPGFARYGNRLWERLDGEFAIAIYDIESHSIVLVRDRFGAKPLHFAQDGNEWHFASEAKAIRLRAERKINRDRACLHLLLGPWAPRTESWFSGVSNLPPGHFLRITSLSADVLPYCTAGCEISETLDRPLRDVIASSVRSRLVDQAPKALLLSGGIDSTVVAALASEASNVTAYTVQFPEAVHFDESESACLTARALGLNLRYVEVKCCSSAIGIWDRMVLALEEPPTDAGYIGVWSLYEAIHADGLRVALTGQGNDELWCGYRDEASRVFEVLGIDWVQKCSQHARRRVRAIPVNDEGLPFWNGPWLGAFLKEEKDREALFRLQLSNDERARSSSALQLAMQTILQRNLDQEDRLAMAHSIESRLPLLSNDLLTRAASYAKFGESSPNNVDKLAFRQAASTILSGRITNSSSKQSFPVPSVLFYGMCRDYVLDNWPRMRLLPPIAGLVNESVGLDECRYALEREPKLAIYLFALDRFSIKWF